MALGLAPARGLAFSNWMGSPPHHAVLLNPAFRFIGARAREGTLGYPQGHRWVAHLGGGQPAAPRLLP